MNKAEYEARAACADLGFTEEEVKAFVESHIANEARREARANDLTNALISIAVDPLRNRLADQCFPSFLGGLPQRFGSAVSRGYDAEDEESARLDRRDRAREMNR